jgi:two-component system alkaline phosphatase synthesis response regulator PhoP
LSYLPHLMKRILIIEDDTDIAALLDIHLSDLGYTTEHCQDGINGLQKAKEQRFALIILDIMLPGMDGLEVCKRLQAENVSTPILMLTARAEELDKVLGLEIGADDYMTKPFSVRELIARVKAILRRTQKEKGPVKDSKVIRSEKLHIDIEKRSVQIDGDKKDLSPKEFDLLVTLATNNGRTFTRQELLTQVWGYDFDGFEHTVNSHINRLRMKVEKDVQNPEYILTTWGVGYRFKDLDS